MASIHCNFGLLDTAPRITDGQQALPLEQVAGDIRFEDVHFEYPTSIVSEMPGRPAPAVIQDFSLHIPAGQTMALVGPTDAGKSTIVKLLLLRFYDIQQGRILLDDHDLRDLRRRDLHQAIGFVSQDVLLFHGVVRENIAYGRFDASEESIIRAARIAEAHDFTMQLPNGYDTIVGERGQKLSGGQRQ